MCDIIRTLPGEFLCNVGCMAVCDVSFFLALWNIWNFVRFWCEKYDNYLQGIKERAFNVLCYNILLFCNSLYIVWAQLSDLNGILLKNEEGIIFFKDLEPFQLYYKKSWSNDVIV